MKRQNLRKMKNGVGNHFWEWVINEKSGGGNNEVEWVKNEKSGGGNNGVEWSIKKAVLGIMECFEKKHAKKHSLSLL